MDMGKPDLAVALKDIRAQYEVLSAKNMNQAEEWYHSKFASVSEAAARNTDNLKQAKDDLSEYRRQVQARTLEIEALRGHNEALERQMADMEDRHSNEMGEMQVEGRTGWRGGGWRGEGGGGRSGSGRVENWVAGLRHGWCNKCMSKISIDFVWVDTFSEMLIIKCSFSII